MIRWIYALVDNRCLFMRENQRVGVGSASFAGHR